MTIKLKPNTFCIIGLHTCTTAYLLYQSLVCVSGGGREGEKSKTSPLPVYFLEFVLYFPDVK